MPQVGSMRSWTNYNMLRHYSATGTMLEELLPRWGDKAAIVRESASETGEKLLIARDSDGNIDGIYHGPLWGPTAGFTKAAYLNGQISLKANRGIVMIYDLPNARVLSYVASQKQLSIYSLTSFSTSSGVVSGFGMSADGQLYASMRTWNNRKPLGIFRLTLSPTTGAASWQRLATSLLSTTEGSSDLVGVDGSRLVGWTAGNNAVWIQAF